MKANRAVLVLKAFNFNQKISSKDFATAMYSRFIKPYARSPRPLN
ncbi:hypothetical protein [Thalassoporum mexicanum]|nr:hypothetical protein [Pseudanabaena sp. PCC 7367]